MKKQTKEIFQYLLAIIVIISIFALFYLMITRPIPKENADVVKIGVGIVFGAFTSVIGYFFGSSMGSKEKTDIINTTQKNDG